MTQDRGPVLFFDGVCGLCHGFVQFVLKADTHKIFLFSFLQSDYAKTQLGDVAVSLDTVVVVDGGVVYEKSEAVFVVLRYLGGWWTLCQIFRFLPRFFLDFMYDIVARYRYVFFGKKEQCWVPEDGVEERFLT